MTNDEWEAQRQRSILAAFQTGRPVFGDSEGELRYADGNEEPIDADVGLPKDIPAATTVSRSRWERLKRWIGIVALIGGCSTSAARDAPSGSAAPTAVDSRPPGAIDDMIAIPSGYYPWDTRSCNTTADYERTARSYQIDRDLVRCDAYRACIKAKRCPSYGHDTCTFYNATVPREAAAKYCAWRGAELPSTGQWQKAARKDGRFFPGGYVFDLSTTCKPGMTGVDVARCFFTSPYGMIVRMLQSRNSGEWTRDDSCPAADDIRGPRSPEPPGKSLAISLEYRLDALTTPLDPYQEFRCVHE